MQWAEIMPLYSSLGNKDCISKKKQKKRNRTLYLLQTVFDYGLVGHSVFNLEAGQKIIR